MTVVIYILALAAYLYFLGQWVVGGYFTIAGDESLSFQWNRDDGQQTSFRVLTVIYIVLTIAFVVAGVAGTMAYF